MLGLLASVFVDKDAVWPDLYKELFLVLLAPAGDITRFYPRTPENGQSEANTLDGPL